MKQVFTNGATGSLATGIGIDDTAITLQSGHGGYFPSLNTAEGEYCIVKISHMGPGFEILKVTGRSGDLLTVERGYEETTRGTWLAGSKVELYLSAATLNNFVQKEDQAGHFRTDVFNAGYGQSVFTLKDDYAIGHNAIEVSINGVVQSPSRFVEVDSKTITMEPLYRSEEVRIRYLTTRYTKYTSAASVAYFPTNAETPIDLQNYIRSLEQRIAKLENK